MSSAIISGSAGGVSGGGALPPQAPVNNQASAPSACWACRASRLGCDRLRGTIPCSRCVRSGKDCHPTNAPLPLPLPAHLPLPLPSPLPQPLSLPQPRAQPPRAPAMSSGGPGRGPQRTAQEQADFEARNRFDNSDSESEVPAATSGFAASLSLRGRWATTAGARPAWKIPAGETRTVADVVLGGRPMEWPAPARAGQKTLEEIEAEEDEDLSTSGKKILTPAQIEQLADADELATLQSFNIFAPLDAELPASNATPLTQVQLAAQESISKKKNRRRPKNKSKKVVDMESVDAESFEAESSPAPESSSAGHSFQSPLVIEDDENDATTAHSSPPPTRGPTPAAEGVTTAKSARKRGKKKSKGGKAQEIVDENPLLEDQGERHYEDQPFLLCCPRISIPHPVNDDDHGDLMTLARRVAGKFPDELVIESKNKYGVVWCDFKIIFGLAYHIKAIDERGINFYGTNDWANGDITEIAVQAPETVSAMEAPNVMIECLVRQKHSVDFVCYGHKSHTFTLFEVQWQGQGEAKTRDLIRKICQNTDRNFYDTLRKYRIEKLHMHL